VLECALYWDVVTLCFARLGRSSRLPGLWVSSSPSLRAPRSEFASGELKEQAETKKKRKREKRGSSLSTQRSSVRAEVPINANLVYRCESGEASQEQNPANPQQKEQQERALTPQTARRRSKRETPGAKGEGFVV
jgi:hypothetical protein